MLRKFLSFVFILAFAPALAHASSVTGTFTTTGNSSALFVHAGEKVRIQVLGSFVATVAVQRSRNGGASYETVRSTTTTLTYEENASPRDYLYRLSDTSWTSGTVSYELDNVQFSQGRVRYSTVPVGSVAYGSFGSVLNPPVAGTLYVADVPVRKKMTAQGIAILNGATCGTDKYILWLFDSTGLAVAHTTLDGTTCSGTDSFQQIAFTQEVALTEQQYFVGARVNGTTDRTRFIAASTFVDNVTSATAHSSLVVGSFGSNIYAIPVPTSLTAGQGPIAYVYGY